MPDPKTPDAPEWTEEQFAKARRGADLPAGVRDRFKAAQEDLAARKRRPGERGPQKAPRKVQVTLRLDPDVVAHFKAAGDGWQTRLNAALRAHISGAEPGAGETE